MPRKTLLFFAVVLAALTAVGAGLYAQQKSAASRKLSTEDWIEIRQLYIRYSTYIATGENEDFAKLWSDDATYDTSATNPPRRGPKEIAAGALNTYKSGFFNIRRPITVNILIDPSPEGAVGRAFFMMLKAGAKDGDPPIIEQSGIYNDTFVKTPDGWKFKTRVYRQGPKASAAALVPSR